MEKQKFQALSRICLNNWHYIDRRVLSFSEGINFFTGHSGSGKSTVIDAMQILLYANTDGRGFFNKAASDDSDRTLIEYLRGMVNIGEDNQFSYLRNRNFSTTIVMELKRTDTGECQSIGVVFDVESAANEISRLFFWHRGPLLESAYRTEGRAMTIDEIREYLMVHYAKEAYYFGPSNERFRKQLYNVYLGGLNEKRFPLLFKRAIPFRMNIRLEDFVKEYICTEQDIHIEDMQESVMQYGRMRKRIGDTCEEIEALRKIQEAYLQVAEKEKKRNTYLYLMNVCEMRKLRNQAAGIQAKIESWSREEQQQQDILQKMEEQIRELEEQIRDVVRKISASGYEELKSQMQALNEIMERLAVSKGSWQRTAAALKGWEEQDLTPNAVLWDIERFAKRSISEEQLLRLQKSLLELRTEVREQQKAVESEIREYTRQEKEIREELRQLRQGKKAYPKELEEARDYIRKGLKEQNGRYIPVEILADLLEIRDDTWRNAVEGYLGSNKLLLLVEPKFTRAAIELYQELDKKKYYRVAVLDTEKVMAASSKAQEGALAEEVLTDVPYARAYIDFILGNVIKCETIEELRECRIGITRECVQYHGFKLQYSNPELYTRRAYIGEVSMRRRIRQLEKMQEELQEKKKPCQELEASCRKILELEYLSRDAREYLSWKKDMEDYPVKEIQKKCLEEKLSEMKEKNISLWKQQQEKLEERCRQQKSKRDEVFRQIEKRKGDIAACKKEYLVRSGELAAKEKSFEWDAALEHKEQEFFGNRKNPNYESMQLSAMKNANEAERETEEAMSALREIRFAYLKKYPNRTFSAEEKTNKPYDELLSHLQYADLSVLYEKADEQAKEAVYLFKQDFIYKIRSAIKAAFVQRDELNRIISQMDFGKDRYRFVISRNKGPDGRYYDMFMDENLEVNPSQMGDFMENQLNLFTMSHEEKYGDLMKELISIFIPPDNATAEELEEAKRNMEKYADYRTYLSFDMQQIIQGQETIRIGLSRMIKKNSGGEGQNPLYVALLASFAQAYRVGRNPRLRVNPTIRLVVLDEAFSKMDAEKVASCIALIRGLGFQAIISATNDKIQNYIENVDKTFVFANPNKKHISIQEFEKKDFVEMKEGLAEEEHFA